MLSKSKISPTVCQPASRTRSTTPRTSSTVKAMCRSPGRFAAGAGSCPPAEGDWNRTTSNMSLPSGPRAITSSTVTFSRPMIRSIHSPLKTPGSLQSKPSSERNRTVSSRSSTTRPTWTKLVTPGRWLSVEVKRLARAGGAPEVARISASWGAAPTPPAATLGRLVVKPRQLAVQDLLGEPQGLRPHRVDRAREVGVCRDRAGPEGLRSRAPGRVDHQISAPTGPRHRQQDALVGADRAHQPDVVAGLDQLLVTDGVVLHPCGRPQRNHQVVHADVVLRGRPRRADVERRAPARAAPDGNLSAQS